MLECSALIRCGGEEIDKCGFLQPLSSEQFWVFFFLIQVGTDKMAQLGHSALY